jgi:hypothetical protein
VPRVWHQIVPMVKPRTPSDYALAVPERVHYQRSLDCSDARHRNTPMQKNCFWRARASDYVLY